MLIPDRADARASTASSGGLPEPARRSGPAAFPVIDLNHSIGRDAVCRHLRGDDRGQCRDPGDGDLQGRRGDGIDGVLRHHLSLVSWQPEYTAYKRSPHSRVTVRRRATSAPARSWFVKSKLSGAWQFDRGERSTCIRVRSRRRFDDLRPARETCEHCHWPTKFVGDRLKVLTTGSANDEANSELKTVLLLRDRRNLQGRQVSRNPLARRSERGRIRYRSDPNRQTIYEVELTTGRRHRSSTYPPAGGRARAGAIRPAGRRRKRDSRRVARDGLRRLSQSPLSHLFQSPAEEASIRASSPRGEIDRSLPYIRRPQGLIALPRTELVITPRTPRPARASARRHPRASTPTPITPKSDAASNPRARSTTPDAALGEVYRTRTSSPR